MKILLTGATGFIGSAFLRLAASRGHEIAGLIRPESEPKNGDAQWLTGTLADAPWDKIEAFAPDVCVHSAWITTPGVYLESPENESYLRWSIDFLGKLRSRGVERAIVLGTCIEYELGGGAFSETHTPLRPTTTYARCKNALRLALEADSQWSAGGLCWARVFYPYGPGESPSRLVSSLIERLASNQSVTIKTPASIRDYIFIDDLAAALVAVAEARIDGPINLGTGAGVTVGEIARAVGSMMNKESLLAMTGPERPDPSDAIVADAARLRSLGWRQAVSLNDGLTRQLRHLGL